MKPITAFPSSPRTQSELILNPDGTVYHLHLRAENIADIVIIVGDPDRVEQISSRFDSVEFTMQKREFCTHTGSLNGTRMTVVSSGIGVDNIDILINELDAAVNIDLSTRQPKSHRRTLTFVRLGTSGTLQPDIPIESFIASAYAIGTDGVPWFYECEMTQKEKSIAEAFAQECRWPSQLADPYCSGADVDLLEKMDFATPGITLTANGFYAPQQREVNVPLAFPELLNAYQNFTYDGLRMTNFEMECSGIYALATMLGHKPLTVCAILANRTLGQFSQSPQKAIDRLINLALNRLTQ